MGEVYHAKETKLTREVAVKVFLEAFARGTLSVRGRSVGGADAGGTPEAPKQDHEVVMLLNFFDELRRRVPLAK